jgi:transcriptional regulator with XRE-family HTH domain
MTKSDKGVKSMESRLERMRTIFAANLKRRMKELNMNQSDLARAIWKEERIDPRGYPQPVNKDRVSAWVNARVLPTQENLQKAAEALDVTPDALLPEMLGPDLFGVRPPPSSQQHYVPDWDLTLRTEGRRVFIAMKCEASLDDAREMVALYAKCVKEFEEARKPSEPGECNWTPPAILSHKN